MPIAMLFLVGIVLVAPKATLAQTNEANKTKLTVTLLYVDKIIEVLANCPNQMTTDRYTKLRSTVRQHLTKALEFQDHGDEKQWGDMSGILATVLTNKKIQDGYSSGKLTFAVHCEIALLNFLDKLPGDQK